MRDRLEELFNRARAFMRRDRDDGEFAAELDEHLALLVEDNLRRGMSSEEARRAARLRLGNPAALREQHRAERGLPRVDTLLQDVRFAIRFIARGRGFSTAAILALALGIGANTAGFTIMYAALLRSLPFDAADDLYVLSWNLRSGRRSNASLTELNEWRAQTKTFAGLAGYSSAMMNLSDDRDLPEQVQGTYLTANAFDVLRQRPMIGRGFTAADEQPGVEPVVIIGARVWRSRYAADREVLGRPIRVNGRPSTIVGVMPDGLKFPESSEIWAPFVPSDAQRARTARVLRVFGRLESGAVPTQARTEFATIAEQSIAANGEQARDLTGIRVETFQTRFIGGAGRPMFMTVMGAVCCLLLIACANVANLLLSRASERAREIGVRVALGASRWRIVRQLLMESLVLGLVGGAIGLGLAAVALPFFDAEMSPSMPYWVEFRLDTTVFAYVAAICVLTAVLFGLVPALQVSKTSQIDVLKEGGRGYTSGYRTRRWSGVMVVSELALTMVLLVGAGLTIRNFMTLYSVDLGVEIDRILATRVTLSPSQYSSPEKRLAFFDQLLPRLSAMPGVEAVALTTGVPPLDGGERLLELEGQSPDVAAPFVGTVTVTPSFFEVLRTPLLRGRSFHDADGASGMETVIINEQLAQRFFAGTDPIGRRIRFTVRSPVAGQPADVWRTIIGICPTIKQGSSLDGYVNAVVYLPFRQDAPASSSIVLRSALPPASIASTVRRAVQAIDGDQPVHDMQTIAQILASDRWWQRTWGSVFGLVAAIALALSSVGLYAVMSYSVAQRTQEIGVRMAVGATRWHVQWLVLKRGLMQIAIGLGLGSAGAVALAKVMPSGLAGTTSSDPAALATIAAVLVVVCVAACIVPARRATRVDPVVALRAE